LFINHHITLHGKGRKMSVYKIIEVVGTSTESWEKAAQEAIATASKSIRDMRIARIAEVEKLDMQIEDGRVLSYRVKLKVSFKYHTNS
jgi:hypothetical protein